MKAIINSDEYEHERKLPQIKIKCGSHGWTKCDTDNPFILIGCYFRLQYSLIKKNAYKSAEICKSIIVFVDAIRPHKCKQIQENAYTQTLVYIIKNSSYPVVRVLFEFVFVVLRSYTRSHTHEKKKFSFLYLSLLRLILANRKQIIQTIYI